MSSSLLGSVLVLFFIFVPSQLQTTTPTQNSDPQAIALAAKAIAALSGGTPITDVTLTGTVTRTAGADVETGSVTMKALGTVNSRIDLSTTAGTRSEIRTNASGSPQGAWIGLDGTSHAMAYHNCMTDAVWFFPVFSILSQAASANTLASYIGQETRNGASVQHLHFTQPFSAANDPNGFLTSLTGEDIYLDATSFLPVAVIFNTHADNDALTNFTVEVDFSNYQASGSSQAPMEIQELLNNSPLLNIAIQTVTLNSGLTTSIFAIQ